MNHKVQPPLRVHIAIPDIEPVRLNLLLIRRNVPHGIDIIRKFQDGCFEDFAFDGVFD